MYEYRGDGRDSADVAVRTACRIFLRPAFRWWPIHGPLTRVLPLLDTALRALPRLPETQYEAVEQATWHGELVRPRTGNRRSQGAILYLHGGAFLFCGLATHRRIVERLAVLTGLPVLAVAYRQLPIGQVDEAIQDVSDAFAWLTDRGIAPESIVCVGDSAGGYLAFALAFHNARTGLGRPAGVVGISPWLDFDCTAKAAHCNSHRDPFVPLDRLARMAVLCAGGRDGKVDPARSLVNLDPRCLPPVLIQCAEDELLRSDAEAMASKLAAAGVEHTLQIWRGQVHAFPVLADLLPESRAALDDIATFVAAVVPTPNVPAA